MIFLKDSLGSSGKGSKLTDIFLRANSYVWRSYGGTTGWRGAFQAAPVPLSSIVSRFIETSKNVIIKHECANVCYNMCI